MNKLSKILLVIIILLVIALGIAIYSSHKNLQKVLESNFSNQTTISTENLSAGMYFLKLNQNEKTTTHKIIKK